MIQVLPQIDRKEFFKIEQLLSKITIPVSSKNNRKGFPRYRAMTLGLTKYRCDRFISCAKANNKHPELFNAVFALGDSICPIPFTSVYVIQNCICPPHKDSGNNGESCIVSLGDYTGCNLVIEDKIYDARYRPIVFDGHKLCHYNTDDLVGNKYSLIFFNIKN